MYNNVHDQVQQKSFNQLNIRMRTITSLCSISQDKVSSGNHRLGGRRTLVEQCMSGASVVLDCSLLGNMLDLQLKGIHHQSWKCHCLIKKNLT